MNKTARKGLGQQCALLSFLGEFNSSSFWDHAKALTNRGGAIAKGIVEGKNVHWVTGKKVKRRQWTLVADRTWPYKCVSGN